MKTLQPRPASITAAALVALALVLSACVSLEQPYPEKHFHLVGASRANAAPALSAGAQDASAPSAQSSAAAGETLLVRQLAISPGFEGRGLVYRRVDGTYEADYYNEFFVSPAAMLTQVVREWLSDAELVDTVVEAGSQLDPTLVIEGSVAQLYGDYTDVAGPQAVIGLELLVLRRTAGQASVLFQGNYEAREPAGSLGPEALIQAWGRGMASMLAEFEDDLRTQL